MTIHKLMLGAFMIVSAVFAQSVLAHAGAQIEFYDVNQDTIMQVGTLHRGTEYSVHFKNSGNEPLAVQMITLPWSALKLLGAPPLRTDLWMIVEPGRDSEVRYMVDPRVNAAMPVSTLINFWSNDPQNPKASVWLQGNIVP